MYSERIDKSLICLGAEGLVEWEELSHYLAERQGTYLINISNHPSNKWDDQQKAGWGGIIDIPFPEIMIDSNFDRIADSMYDKVKNMKVIDLNPSNCTIMIQGQHPATFSMVACFMNAGFTVLSAFTERIVTDHEDGSKTSVFRFGGYQRYWSRYITQDFLENLFKEHFGEDKLLI